MYTNNIIRLVSCRKKFESFNLRQKHKTLIKTVQMSLRKIMKFIGVSQRFCCAQYLWRVHLVTEAVQAFLGTCSDRWYRGSWCVTTLFIALLRVWFESFADRRATESNSGNCILGVRTGSKRSKREHLLCERWRWSDQMVQEMLLGLEEPQPSSKVRRCLWCNGYRRRIWTRRHEFKSWTWLIAFHIALIPLGKVWIQIFSIQLWVNSRADYVLQPWWGN